MSKQRHALKANLSKTRRELPSLEEVFGSKEAIPSAPVPVSGPSYLEWKSSIQQEWNDWLARLETNWKKEKEALAGNASQWEGKLITLQRKSPAIAEKLDRLDALLKGDTKGSEYSELKKEIDGEFLVFQKSDRNINRAANAINQKLKEIKAEESRVNKRLVVAKKAVLKEQYVTNCYLALLEETHPVAIGVLKKLSRNQYLHPDIRKGTFPQPYPIEPEPVKASHNRSLTFADGLNNQEENVSEAGDLTQTAYVMREGLEGTVNPSYPDNSKSKTLTMITDAPTVFHTPHVDDDGKISWEKCFFSNKGKTLEELVKREAPAKKIIKELSSYSCHTR